MSVASSESVNRASPKWKPYPYYRDAGVQWLGTVPDHWEVKRVKRIFQAVNGSTPRSSESDYWDGDIPWVTPDDLGALSTMAINTTARSITGSGYQSCGTTLVPQGSIVLSTRAPIGHLALAGVPLCTNQGCRCLVPHTEICADFYYNVFVAAIHELESWGMGSTFLELSKTKLESISIVSPPLSEQRVIAAFLDRETAKIDSLVSAKERQIGVLREKKTAVITQAVMHGLDANVASRDSGVEWLGMVPGHWDIRRNKTIFAEVDERSTTDSEELLTVSHITGVTPRAEKRGVNMFLAETTEGYKTCQVDDLVINTMWAWMGALGFTNYAGVVSPSYHVYRLRSTDLVMPKYLDLLYRASAHLCEIMRYSRGIWTSRLRLYPEEFLGMRTPVPPLDEQKRICEHIEAETGLIDGVIDANIKHIELLRERRTALISAAVTGQIDVREEV